jgi:hypothetical protein
MSRIPDYDGPAFLLFSPIEEITATCTTPYNHRAIGFRNCESAFHLVDTILGGRLLRTSGQFRMVGLLLRLWPLM